MTTLELPASIRDLMSSMMNDIEQISRERIEQEAKANPKAYRDCNQMERGKGTNFRYYVAPKDARPGTRVCFCYTKHRNVAGFYLSFTEVWKGRNGSRSNWHGWETKQAAIDYCKERLRDASKPKAERRYAIPKVRVS